MTDTAWDPLRQELARWAQAGRKPVFWLRDDDAVEPTPALDRILSLTERFRVPLLLASIPAHATQALAERLKSEDRVTVGVHGWSHDNHAPTNQKKQELGSHRPDSAVLDDLRRGLIRIRRLFGKRAVPVLVPPWNRIDPALLPALPSLGFRALSVYGPPKPAPLVMINSTVDIMDWHGARGCLPTQVLIELIVAQLRAAFIGNEAIGVLTHHLVHDDAAWVFLEHLFEITCDCNTQWLSYDALLVRARGNGAAIRS